MEEITDDNNKMIEENMDTDENEFTYNFIDIPWDDRTKRSKVLIVLLLLAIFFATLGLVINNFVAHYNNFRQDESFTREVNCNLLKVDEYLYVARILSVASQQMICVGAVISENSVLTSEVCLKTETVRLYVGSATDQHCKKGFSVGAVESLPQNLALVSMKISHCANVIRIGTNVNRQSHAFIIGRPLRGERSLSQQLVSLDISDNYTHNGQLTDKSRHSDAICVKYISRCPIGAGDLLVQGERLLGIASTGVQRRTNGVVCFANISRIKSKQKMDVD